MDLSHASPALYIAISLIVPTLGDAVTYGAWRDRTFGWWVLDALQHGAVGLAVTLPVLLALGGLWPWAAAFAAATLVDVDHLVHFPQWWPMTKSDSTNRRHIHSLLTATLAGCVAGVLGGSVLWAWLPFTAVLSHLLRDSVMGTVPILFPVRFALRLTRPIYYAAEIILCGVSCALASMAHG